MSKIQTKRRILCAFTVALVAGSTAPLTFADDLPGIGHTVPLTRFAYVSDYGPFDYILLVGGDPGAYPFKTIATTIKAVVIPLAFTVIDQDGTVATFDPTQANPCDANFSAIDRFKHSPLVQPIPLTFNGVNVGTFQYIPGYKRASFWGFLNGRHVEDTIDWHFPMKSGFFPLPPVPGTILGDAASCTQRAQLPTGFIEDIVKGTVIPILQSAGVLSTDEFALFITRDVVDAGSGGGSTNGAHGHTPDAYDEQHPPQTFAWAEYNSTEVYLNGPGARGQDIFSLSHEVGEWMMDPLNNNTTPSWNNPQSKACATRLEVGDPLHGTNNASPISLNAGWYHPTELAFFSWFYNKTAPSFGAGGVYSSYGTFINPHAPCP